MPPPEEACTTLLLWRSSGTSEREAPALLRTTTWYRYPVTGTVTVAFPAEERMSARRGAAAKRSFTFPELDVARSVADRIAVPVMVPELVLIWMGPDVPVSLTHPVPPSITTESARPDTVSLPDPECTTTASPGGTATWKLEPQ